MIPLNGASLAPTHRRSNSSFPPTRWGFYGYYLFQVVSDRHPHRLSRRR